MMSFTLASPSRECGWNAAGMEPAMRGLLIPDTVAPSAHGCEQVGVPVGEDRRLGRPNREGAVVTLGSGFDGSKSHHYKRSRTPARNKTRSCRWTCIPGLRCFLLWVI